MGLWLNLLSYCSGLYLDQCEIDRIWKYCICFLEDIGECVFTI